MKTCHELPLDPLPPVALTIGNFDGVHRGHVEMLKKLRTEAKKRHLLASAITFQNHPSTILNPGTTPLLICTQEHKKRLLRDAGIDLLYSLPFTKEIAEQTPEDFISHLQSTQPFDLLLLGSDATIGKNRTGTQEHLQSLAQKYGFELEYFPDLTHEGARISSRRIRECIQQGCLKEASFLLGRPYSINGVVIQGQGRGAGLGFHTANVAVEGLCTPPFGVYAVKVHHKEQIYSGVANLGKAPTVREDAPPLLEVHLFDTHLDLYHLHIEVEFHAYLRPEMRFSSLEALKSQIQKDVESVKKMLS